ncbi:serine/arginine repetitive matrix protein 1-like [Leopardus geoffroyi]|uniref:serine/arginine repetitive matrix protein 1-like n=1 Tax=Leopardus geoffroyi TaxID=46844 RepID=UPI001E25FF31|nr:serine/arginine repetitive matrix protein 1-like [Leopardus geoffroyi]
MQALKCLLWEDVEKPERSHAAGGQAGRRPPRELGRSSDGRAWDCQTAQQLHCGARPWSENRSPHPRTRPSPQRRGRRPARFHSANGHRRINGFQTNVSPHHDAIRRTQAVVSPRTFLKEVRTQVFRDAARLGVPPFPAWEGHPLTSALLGHGTTLPREMASPSTEHRARDRARPLCLTRVPRPPDGTSRRVTWRRVLTALPPRRVPTRGGRVSSRPRHILPRPATVPRRGSARTLLATVTQPHGAGRPTSLPRRRSARQTRSAGNSRGWGSPEGVRSPGRPQ